MDLDSGVPKVGDEFDSESSEGDEAVAGRERGRRRWSGGGGGTGGKAAEAGDMGRVERGHSPVDVDHGGGRVASEVGINLIALVLEYIDFAENLLPKIVGCLSDLCYFLD